MKQLTSIWLRSAIVAALGLTATAAPAAQASCAANTTCVETRTFAATVTQLRTSKQNNARVLTTTIRFHNKSGKPLTLGYVRDSGIAIDDQGNRFVVPQTNGARGIGEIIGNTFEAKFMLQPGETSDARLEFIWGPGSAPNGTSYDLDLAIREIDSTGADQFRLGAEHALHFANVVEGAAKPAAAQSTTVAAAESDPCGGRPGCYNAGPFVAEIQQLMASQVAGAARHQTLTLNVRIRNTSGQPIILAYKPTSSAAIDNLGNRYVYGRPGTHDTSFKGIGIVARNTADPQFTLAPGQSRNAQFNVTRFNAAGQQLGTGYSYDVVLVELEALPSQQLRTLREHSLSFPNLSARSYTSATNTANTSQTDVAVDEVAHKVIDLFQKMKKR